MIERIEDLPARVDGLRARGTVTKADYDRVVLPLLGAARRERRRLRLLCHFGPDFERFTLGAAVQDFRVGVQSLRRIDRLALVTDRGWLRKTSSALGSVLPYAVHVYRGSELASAIEWLAAPVEQLTSLQHTIVADTGVLVVEPEQPIRSEDVEALETTTERWIDAHSRVLPGWENLGGLLRHVQFVRTYHRAIRQVAVAADGQLAVIAPTLVDPLVCADVQHFGYHGFADAVTWAASL